MIINTHEELVAAMREIDWLRTVQALGDISKQTADRIKEIESALEYYAQS